MIPRFSILIPTWNNLQYLDLAVSSLRKNSAVDHEILVFFNGMTDECRRWADGKNVVWIGDDANLGVCAAVNQLARKATTPYVCFFNDDMYALPGWDTALAAHLDDAKPIWLSGTAIEAGRATRCYIGGHDYGTSPADFRESDLLAEFRALQRGHDVISTWTPILLSKSDWDAVGGLDEAYFPGNGSDPDLAMKMYKHGCRHFIGVGSSLVYHFSRRTISRFDNTEVPDPKAIFLRKWGMPWSYFLHRVLQRGEKASPELLADIKDAKHLGLMAWWLRRLSGRV